VLPGKAFGCGAARSTCYRQAVTRHHQRFALRDVLYAGARLTGATVDTWEDDQGRPQWTVRIVGRMGGLEPNGELSGLIGSGERLGGRVVTDGGPVEHARRERIVEFRGAGRLAQVVDAIVLPPAR
jgi:hypothetical protein